MAHMANHTVGSIHAFPTSKHKSIHPQPHLQMVFFISNHVSYLKSSVPTSGKCRTKVALSRVFTNRSPALHEENSPACCSCEYFDLHKEIVPYGEAWTWQKDIVREKKVLIDKNEECPDTLIILQHRPVYTMGTASSEKYLNFDIKDAPFDIYRTERGGEVTYHGPGQLVMYPIFNLRNHKMDLHWYLRALEEVVIRVLSSTFSISASRVDGLTGVWVGNRKLAAVGIRVSQWITYHGLALNVTTDMTPFRWIVPCGIQNRQVGSIKELLGEFQLQSDGEGINTRNCNDTQLIDVAYEALLKEFSDVFQIEMHQKAIPSLEFIKREPIKLPL